MAHLAASWMVKCSHPLGQGTGPALGLAWSSRLPTCQGTGAAVGPARTTVLWDMLIPRDAGIVDTVRIPPVPVLGEIRWGQVLMWPRIGPGKRSGQWKPTLERMGPPLPHQGHKSNRFSFSPLPFPKMWKFQSLTQKSHQQSPGLLEADCDRASPKYPSAHQQSSERRELPKPANPTVPWM